MKRGVGFLCIGALAIGIAAFGNTGTAAAAPLDVLSGISQLAENTVSGLSETVGVAGETLGQTVVQTVGLTVGDTVGESVGQTVGEAARQTVTVVETVIPPIGQTLGQTLGETVEQTVGTAELLEQVGDTADTALQSVMEVALEPLRVITSSVAPSSTAPPTENIPPSTTPPPEHKPASGSVTPQASASAPSSASELSSQAGPKTESKPVPAASVSQKHGFPVTPEAATPYRTAKTENKQNPDVPRAVRKPGAHTPDSKSAKKPSAANKLAKFTQSQPPLRSTETSSPPVGTIPDVVTNAAFGSQPPPSAGNSGFFHPTLGDAVLTETLFLQSSGRRNYAKNSKLLITKRGNEPPTPPPRSSFFSRGTESARKRSGVYAVRNRNTAPIAGGTGRPIRHSQSLCPRTVAATR